MAKQQKVEYSVRLRKLRNGTDGADGQSSFKSIVFLRAASQPSAPTGGSYASPVPGGWSDGIPAENAASGYPCWMTSRTFTSDGKAPQDSAWKQPQKISDTSDFDVCFSSQEEQPSAPTSHGTQNTSVWHETGTADDIWMATSRCTNGKWSEWSINKIKGERGDDGVGAYALDLDNENVNIGLTTSGNSLYPASGYNKGESNIYAVGGASTSPVITQMSLMNATGTTPLITSTSTATATTYTNSTQGYTVTLYTNKISAVFDTSVAHNKGERIELKLKGKIQVTDSAGSRQVYAYKTMSFMFQPPGADGITPTVYELKPSAASVVIGTDGSRRPSTASCQVVKRVGNSVTTLDTVSGIIAEGLEIQATINGTVHESTAAVELDEAESLRWDLYDSSMRRLDFEETAFVADGEKGNTGNTGANAITAFVRPTAINYTYGKSKNVDVVYGVSDGGTEVTSGVTITQVMIYSATHSHISNLDGLYWVSSLNKIGIAATATFQGRIDFTLSYKGKTYTATIQVNQVLDGSPGAPGLVCRVTEWAEGQYYRNDTELLGDDSRISETENGDGICRLDFVVRKDANGSAIGYWKCKTSHTSSSQNLPRTKGDTDEWEKLSSPGPLYSPFILADNAVIAFMQSNHLKVFGKDGTLRAGISGTANGGYPIFYANPSDQSDTATARWQQLENGNAIYGEPQKARIFLNASPSAGGLPRMEIFDNEGKVAAIFDGSTKTTAESIFGSSSTSTSDSIRLTSISVSLASGQEINDYRKQISLTCTQDSILSVSAAKLHVYGEASSTVKGDNEVTVTAQFVVDGNVMGQSVFTIDDGGSVSSSTPNVIQVPASQFAVSAGTHTVTISLLVERLNGASTGTASATIAVKESAITATIATAMQQCRYFANGLIIGSSSSNYCMVWNNGGSMNFHIENASCGLEVTADGVKIKRKGSIQGFVEL